MNQLDSLSPLESIYRQKLHDLFLRVDPKKPEKGVRALLARARRRVETEGIAPEQALEEIYRGAVERTERRLELLGACELQLSSGKPDTSSV